MRGSTLLTSAILAAVASAQIKGFNYGSTFTDGSPKDQAEFEKEFNAAKNLKGASGFTSARLFTTIQSPTVSDPILAIPAAIATGTHLLLGLWASGGDAVFQNDLNALTKAIAQYGQKFVDLIDGCSIGSEDLYRNSPTGIENKSLPGANPDTLVRYIGMVRDALKNTAASKVPLGHVDTWTAYVNGSNNAVIAALDWIGVDSYPYFQYQVPNSIDNAHQVFFDSYDATVAASMGKPVWVTETGWPVSGPKSGDAVASVDNAKKYWDNVVCALFGKTNTWYFTIQDAEPTTPSPSFGLVAGPDIGTTAAFDLTCPPPGSLSSPSPSPSPSPTPDEQTTLTTTTTSPPSTPSSAPAFLASGSSSTSNSTTTASGTATGSSPSGTGSSSNPTETGGSGGTTTGSSPATTTSPSAAGKVSASTGLMGIVLAFAAALF